MMTRQDHVIIAEALRKVRTTWGLTDNVNTRDEALFNDVVDAISRTLGKDNSRFSPERFSTAIYGSFETSIQIREEDRLGVTEILDESTVSDQSFLDNYDPS